MTRVSFNIPPSPINANKSSICCISTAIKNVVPINSNQYMRNKSGVNSGVVWTRELSLSSATNRLMG